MADTSYTGRKTWEAQRRHPPKGTGSTRLVHAARRLSYTVRRNGGFFALAALVVGAILLTNGVGKRPTERFTATAIDGDSLRAAGKEIRLAGIDAPEQLQICGDEHGGKWGCGRQAHAFLSTLVSRGALTCTSSGTDRYGRTRATCSAGDVDDIGDAMVRAGYAVSYMGVGYWAAELKARWNKRGVWSGTFERPQEWRRRHPRTGDRG